MLYLLFQVLYRVHQKILIKIFGHCLQEVTKHGVPLDEDDLFNYNCFLSDPSSILNHWSSCIRVHLYLQSLLKAQTQRNLSHNSAALNIDKGQSAFRPNLMARRFIDGANILIEKERLSFGIENCAERQKLLFIIMDLIIVDIFQFMLAD